MIRCKCGCSQFIAQEKQTWNVVVYFNSDRTVMSEQDLCVLDAESPIGPYICRECGEVYKSVSDLPDDEEEDNI